MPMSSIILQNHTNLREQGFSIIEALIASVIVAVVIGATFRFFGTTVSTIFKSGEIASANSIIDADISRILTLSETYNACTVPTGTFVDCPTAEFGDSWYYFPQPTAGDPVQTEADVQAFFDACNYPTVPTTVAKHITQDFVSQIGTSDVSIGSRVTRLAALRQSPSDPSDHIVVVRWRHPGFERVLKIAPVVSSWCP
ncbi:MULTISPECIES: type II secretion system protein J [Aphanothece]|uniref:type II secretion system protein J n=1 Tax=Aphanothece TaxID=1121 RepID=UPI00398E5995